MHYVARINGIGDQLPPATALSFIGSVNQLGGPVDGIPLPYWYVMQLGQLGGCSTLAGRRYSQAEVKGLLAQAGWPSNLIETMSAIVMGESSGYAEAHNGCGEDSWGLGQVYITVHPEYTAQDMKDPIKNLRACYKIYTDRGGGDKGFRAWGAYGNGSYKQFLNGGGSAVNPSPGTGSATGSSTALIAGVSTGALLLGLVVLVALRD